MILLGTAAMLMRSDEKRRSSEEAVRTAEAHYQVLFESSPLPMWVVDRETLRYLAVNDAAIAHYGYSREEFLSMHIGQLRPAEDFAAVKATLPGERAGLQKLGIWRHLKKDGTLIDVEIATHTLAFEGRSAWLALAYDVTDRLRAEETLRKLSRAVEQSPVSVVITDTKGDIEYVNPKFTQATGYTAAEVRGMNPRILKSGEQSPELYQNLWETITSGGEWRGEFHNRKMNGDLFWEFASISPIADDRGRITHFLAVKEDITERKHAEEALRASEQRFRSYFELGLIGMAITSPTKGLLEVNDEFCRILGYERGELMTRTWAELTHPDDLAADVSQFDRVLSGEIDGYSMEKRWIRKDSRIVDSVISVKCVRHDDGSIDHFVALVHDISDRKRAEEALARSELRFRSLIENALDIIAVVAPDGALHYTSPSIERVLGYDPERLASASVFDLIHPDDLPGARERFRRTLEAGTRFEQVDVRVRHANASWRTLAMIGKPAPPETGTRGLILNARDVTESRAVEEQLRQAQKMEAVGRLAGGIAHDFNNLLTAIMGYGELAASRLTTEDPARAELSEIARAARRAADLTGQLLAFSRKQVLQPRVVSLNEIVGDTEKLLRRLIGEDVELVTRLREPLGSVKADPGQLGQALVNLAINSRDAMPRGGTLTIETSEVDLDADYSAFHFDVPPGRYVVLAVSDTGTGMDAQTLSHVFEPFFTTKEAGRGTGLGLSMVYGVVKQSGGHVTAYSEPGIGTTFRILLPRVEGVPGSERAPSAPAAPAGGAETILVVEDEEAVRRLACRSLEIQGYRVLPAATAAEALLLCENHAGEIHLMVTDVVMPQMGGRALAERAAAARPRMKVLFMSGYTDDAIMQHGVLDVGVAFLQKPFTPRSLAQKVREVLDAPAGTGT